MVDIVYADFETRSLLSPDTHGNWNYTRHKSTRVLSFQWKYPNDIARAWVPDNWYQTLGWSWNDFNASLNQREGPDIKLATDEEFDDFLSLVSGPDAPILCFWNADFDRDIWGNVGVKLYDFPKLPIEQFICAMVQGHASCLPGGLGEAAKEVGAHKKLATGKDLISKLCDAHRPWDAYQASLMPDMVKYGAGDVYALEDIFLTCRRFTVEEWGEYHDRVKINQRGIPFDAEFAKAAGQFAELEIEEINETLDKLTQGVISKITQNQRKPKWVWNLLLENQTKTAEAIRKRITNTKKVDKKTGEHPLYFDKDVQAYLIESILSREEAFEDLGADTYTLLRDFTIACQDGRGTASHKYVKMLQTAGEDTGRLHYTIQHGKAGATGRNSSMGIQIHNLPRDMLGTSPEESLDVIEQIIEAVNTGTIKDRVDALKQYYGLGVQGILSRLVRPTLCAKPGHVFVFADLRQIEARVLPWLFDNTAGEEILDIFRSGQDIYCAIISSVLGWEVPKSDKDNRQLGKTIALGCQYGLGYNTFLEQCRIAKPKPIPMTEARAKEIVYGWRDANPAYKRFWYGCTGAAFSAINNPYVDYTVGRLTYMYDPDLMRGSLLCYLPSGRPLVYREARIKVIEDEVTGKKERAITYLKLKGSAVFRNKIWHGLLVENATQGTATADYLRYCIHKLEPWLIADVHDEVIAECPVERADEVRSLMQECLNSQPSWAAGLPTADETIVSPFYHK